MSNVVASMIADWRAARAELAALERAEHADITDRFGRVWTWWKGDLYRHDKGLAVPQKFLTEGWVGLPKRELKDNPNYELCEICKSEW
ncbi:hypothetical protein ACFRAQ_34905 [Nocardia sp. NPDC056611]|uniref:hypothetical protein n=1 Tax=Nocardia sp. NPDC056611 TaxID=3345877 RepID=UPI0036727009